jgi:hypothetical protein
MADTATLTAPAAPKEKKLSKANQTTLDELSKNPKMTPDLLELFKATILEVKESSESGTRKPRSLSMQFSPEAAKIFALRVVEGKSQGEVETELDIDAQKVNQGVREVGYKIIVQLLKDEEDKDEHPYTDRINEILTTNATGKARTRTEKDEVQGGSDATAPSENPADEIEAPTVDASDIDDILSAD